MADWKERLGMVYSTNPDFTYDCGEVAEEETLAPEKQTLRVWRDTKGRGGKVATVVRGFVGRATIWRHLVATSSEVVAWVARSRRVR